ncbi:Fe(3+)-hydroxamate ABC transporter permease FhuB [Aureimonas leprariae]|uniref:Fe(3+)-hydroxamate ABC transporter permease FhuB n=1 Tax=Plantimonas leprariae TaxID=2615207 RepID=A0A7V7PSN9_9HYPH|nr:Fe(3+)-hydroxamate ABC transporter permease FhuB [Aureimonas leprariae]
MADKRLTLLATALALLAALAAAAVVGDPLLHVLSPEGAAGYDAERIVFLNATLPRLAMALLCGSALGVSGAILQQVLRNPLASPTTIGLDAGARLALTIATLYSPALIGVGRDVVAIVGSVASALLTFMLARRRGFAPLALVLAGLVVTLYCGALAGTLTLLDSRWLASLFIWGSGSLAQQSWQPAIDLALRLALTLVPLFLLLRPLRLLDLGEDAARGLGLSIVTIRVASLGVALALAAFVTAAVGVIGFVGLVAPLAARLGGARGLGARLGWSAIIGSLLLLLTDLAVQLAAGSYGDLLPTGVVTAVLGSPILLWLLPRLRLLSAPHAGRMVPRYDVPRTRAGVAAAILLLGVLVAVALLFGRAPNGDWQWLAADRWAEILPWRWPRLVAAAAAGALLGAAGLALQRLSGNEMASPELLGVSGGAILAVALAILTSMPALPGGNFLPAAVGAFVVLVAILAFARRSGFAPERVLLAGVAINALLDAFIGFLSAAGDPRAIMLLAMLGGSTSTVTEAEAFRTVALAALFCAGTVAAARWLAVLPLGEASARSLGVPVPRVRFALLVLVAGATAAATPIVGPLTFVGLLAPRIAGLMGVVRPVPAVIASVTVGAALLVVADWLGRVLAFPFQLPTGIMASLVGAPLMFWLLQRREA